MYIYIIFVYLFNITMEYMETAQKNKKHIDKIIFLWYDEIFNY